MMAVLKIFGESLEYLAVTTYLFTFIAGGFIGTALAIYILVYTKFWWLCLLYLSWIWIFDRKTCDREGRRVEWIRNWSLWKYAAKYFPVKLEKMPFIELDPKRNYLFCSFPHGVVATGIYLTSCSNEVGLREMFPHHKPHPCTLGYHFLIPFYREWNFSLGARSVSAESLNYILSKDEGGNALVMTPGGAAESFYCKPGQYKFVLKNRKGFVRIALLNGSPLVPVLCFGETDLYSQVEGKTLRRLQKLFKRITGVSPIIPLGRGFLHSRFGILPHRKPIHILVCNPIDVQKTENPTREEIDELHQKFVEQLVEAFENQKKYYIKNHEDVHIELV